MKAETKATKKKVSSEEVLRIASLAKLDLSEEEVEKYTSQLNDILRCTEQINEPDTDDIEPLSHVLELENVFRKDRGKPSMTEEAALMSAPESDGDYFVVPSVIDRSS